MTAQLKNVAGLALKLSPPEREELADTLLSSLDDQPLNEVDEAWIQEAERRYQELKDGKVKGIPGGQVIAEIRQELGWQS